MDAETTQRLAEKQAAESAVREGEAAVAAAEAALAAAQAQAAQPAYAQPAYAQGQAPYAPTPDAQAQAPRTPMQGQAPCAPQPGQPAPTLENGKGAWSSFPYPLVCVIVFLLEGFLFNMWHPGWVVFLTIPIYYWIAHIIEGDPDQH